MSQTSSTQCSNCGRTKMKFDVFTTKCSDHSYVLCNPCTRKLRGEECPECKSERGSSNGSPNGNGKVGSSGDKQKEQELKKIMKDLLLSEEENRLLLKEKNSLERERDQKDIQIKNIELEIYKAKDQAAVKLDQLKADHAKEVAKLKEQFEKESNAAVKKTADQYQQKIDKLAQQKQDIKKNAELQKQQAIKKSELEKTLLSTSFQNQKQALIIEMQNKRNEEAAAAEAKLKDKTQALTEQIEFHKSKYENQVPQLKAKSEKEKQQLLNSFKAEKDTLNSNFAKEKLQLQQQFDFEKENIIEDYKKQHGELQGSFIMEKEGLEEQLQKKNEELQHTIDRVNQQKKTLRQQHELRQNELKSKLQDYESVMSQQKQQLEKSSTQNLKLNNYIQSQGHSLEYYNKELNEFEEYVTRNNNLIVAQFKSLDQTYSEPTPEKLKQVQLLVSQYKTVGETTQHPVLKKIFLQKEPIVTNYIVDFMKNFDLHLQDIEVSDIFHLDSERGKKLKRVVEKIDLVRTLDNKNINDSIEIYFFPKLFQKFRQLLTKFNTQIVAYNKDISEFELIKEINHYYTFTDYLNTEFPQHRDACLPEYKVLDETIQSAFNRFITAYNQIKEEKPAERLEDYLANAEKLKKFIQILHHGKQYKKYTFYLQQHLGMKVQEIKWQILSTLNSNKKGLRTKLQSLIQSRVYYDCFLYQKIFKKLKIFDEILTKEENSYHNFNFTELFNKILNFLKILKEEKLNLVDVIITDDKITIDDLQREYASISFDESIKNRYLYKIKNVMQNRSTLIRKINGNTLITNKDLHQFELFFIESLELKQIKQISDIPEVQDQIQLCNEKIVILLEYLEQCFNTCYSNSLQFKELEETNRNIKHYNQFETFAQKYFPPQHQDFAKKVQRNKNYRLPKPETEGECVYNTLLRFNTNRSQVLAQITNTPEQPLKDEHFDFYTNMVKYVPKTSVNKLQAKLYKSIDQSIKELQGKEWAQGEVSSPSERGLMQKLNKLENKEIAYYRELITIHKNKVIEQRQKLISNEKRKLKEDDFENLQLFLEECKKHEKNNKFYKLYMNILEEYMNYSYDNISNDTDKKTHFLNNLYKLKLARTTPSIRDIFKSKEYKIYFCRPELLSIRNNVAVIEKSEGESETVIQNACEMLMNLVRLYAVYIEHEDKSLLDDRERQRLHQQIYNIKHDVTSNYESLCKNLEHEKLFEEACNRKRLFLQLIKIEIYSKLMRRMHHLHPFENYFKLRGLYDEIVKRINIKIEKVYEEIKQFRFYKDEFKLQYDNRHFLFEHLKKVEHIVEVFKDIKYKLYKFEHYLKNNYLDELNLKSLNYKEVVRVVEMSWIKEYAIIKKEISEMFHNNQMEIVLKYKMILHEQEIVRNDNLLSCNEMIKEEYDFKKIVIEELVQIEDKLEKHVHNLEKDYETFTFTVKKMEEKKKMHTETERARIRMKYERLINEVKNSFQQIQSEEARQQKIDGEINTLCNQSKSEEEILLKTEAVKVESLRTKFDTKSEKVIQKIFEHFVTLKKIEANFDAEIEELCRQIFNKVQLQIDKYDKNLKAAFLNYIKKSKNNDIIMGANSMNIFKGISEEQFQKNTKDMNDIHKILSKSPQTANNEALTKKLVVAFEEYQKQLIRVEKDFEETKSETRILQLIKQTKTEANELTPPIIIARIFAVYAIYRNIDSHQEEINFDGNPHAAQVVAILLLVNAQDMQYAKLDNKLIEVKTGEGKSRVLGGLNCYLALKGYDVYCGCYSSYLSKRDEEEFHSLFVRFGVSDNITYGAFSEHCQSLFNESNKHNFKDVTKKVLLNEKLTAPQLSYLEKLNRLLKHEGENNRILVIDEVDVFFDEKYFGQLYTPGVAVDSPEVKILMRFIWEHRNDGQLNRMTFQSEQYGNLLALYPHLKELLKNQVESMLHACKNYNIHPYEIRNHEIQYVDNDSVNEKLNFGYSTAFASFYEYERGKISEENYNKNANISLIIGQFSYAELPKYFSHIMGVSGTVEAMSDFRKKIMRQDYKIGDIFCLPSIYGESRRNMIPPTVCEKVDFMSHLLSRIREVRKQQRPILVFFQTEEKLNIVANSPELNQFSTNIYKITQKMPPQMRNPLINYAGTRNRITLISSAFSRGTDFVVFDTDINEKGGMHVIQTYISKNYSDFIQISGRTARQGKNGSFEMIITTDDLSKENIPLVGGMELLELIQRSWEVNDVKHGQELEKSIVKAYEQHKTTFEVVSSLTKENSKLVDAVKRLNYNEIKSQTIRTVIAIDGTGSMGAALNAVFSILNDTISRTQEIISMRMPNISFEHKIMIYRNYNIRPMDRVLEQSNFSKDSRYLEDFMSCIKPEGGLGNEAHEILFYEIGKVYEIESIDQIIIIGDAPANKYEEMVKHRKKFHGEALWSTKYPLLPSIEAYSEVALKQKIPVHSFYILRRKEDPEAINWDNNVTKYFEELSRKSQGLSDQLNIRDQERAKVQLTDFISERVLELIGGKDLVQIYKQMYSKRYI